MACAKPRAQWRAPCPLRRWPALARARAPRSAACRSSDPSRGADQALSEVLQLAQVQQSAVGLEPQPAGARRKRAAAPGAPKSHGGSTENAPAPGGGAQLAPPRAARAELHHQRLFRKFGGVMHDPTRLYQHDIVLHLCCSPAVPRAARQAYEAMRPGTLQEVIRRRVAVENELRALQQTAQLHFHQACKWQRVALEEGGTLHEVDVPKELQKVRQLTGAN
jgi:hypothetical protein